MRGASTNSLQQPPDDTPIGSGRSSIVSAKGVEALASPEASGSARKLPLCVVVAIVQSRSPALADIIGARRVRTAVMISSGSIPWR